MHFFTDPTFLAPQEKDDEFGHITSHGSGLGNSFQVTSIHRSSTGGDFNNSNYLIDNHNPPAIAVTSGRICVLGCPTQTASNNNYDLEIVTIVLKPDTQPGGNLPNVKYYVYRGILYKSLFFPRTSNPTADGTVYERARVNTDNATIIPFIQRAQNYYNISPINFNSTDFDERYLGMTYGTSKTGAVPPVRIRTEDLIGHLSNVSLDEIFNANWDILNPAFGNGNIAELPRVNEGELIGFFRDKNHDLGPGNSVEKGTFGFEIIVDGSNNGGYRLKSPGGSERFITPSDPVYKMVAGSNVNLVETEYMNPIFRKIGQSQLGSSKPFYNISQKMEILNYLDPAAFYGAFGNQGIGANLTVITGGAPQLMGFGGGITNLHDDIYRQLLDYQCAKTDNSNVPISTGSLFYNKNAIYIDIRDRYNNPYNIYRDKSYIEDSSSEHNLEIHFDNNSNPSYNADYYGKDSGDNTQVFNSVSDWPILIIRPEIIDTGTPSNNRQGFPNIPIPAPPAVIPDFVNINLSFPNISQSNGESMLYVQNGVNNIDFNCNLISNATNPINRNSLNSRFNGFVKIPSQPMGEFSDDIGLMTPLFSNPAFVTQYVPIANYFKIWHIFQSSEFKSCEKIKNYFDEDSPNTVGSPMNTDPANGTEMKDYPAPLEFHPHNYLDYVFPLDFQHKWNGWAENRIRSSLFSDGTYIDNTPYSGEDFIGTIGIARDADSNNITDPAQVTFFAIKNNLSQIPFRLIDRSFRELSMVVGTTIEPSSFSYLQFIGDLAGDQLVIRQANINGQTFRYFQTLNVGNVLVDSITHISMNKLDYDAAINNFVQDPTMVLEPFDQILKAYWSFKPVDNIYDNISNKQLVKYRVFIKYLSNGGSGSSTPSLWKDYDTGFYSHQIVDDIDISRLNTPAFHEGNPNTGFGINNVNISGTNVDEIETTVYLLKGLSISYQEFLRYKLFFENNIKSVWTSNGVPGITNPIEYNVGLLAGSGAPSNPTTPISAKKIIIREATPNQLRGLKDKELIFTVERSQFSSVVNWAGGGAPTPNSDRSAVTTNFDPNTNNLYARIGRMVFQETRLVSNDGNSDFFNVANPCIVLAEYLGDNSPAHEFGHALGLADRYTFLTQVDNNLDIVPNTGRPVSLFLPVGYDSDYAQNIRWLNNLMSFGGKIPNPNVAGYPFDYTNELSDENFPTLITGYESSDNNANSNGLGNNFFITNTQWNIIKSFANDLTASESNPNVSPIFINQSVVYFIPALPIGNNPAVLSFVGYDPDTDTFYSDYNYSGSNTSMIGRSNNSNSPVSGFIGPFNLNNGLSSALASRQLVSQIAATDKQALLNIKLGNDVQSILPTINTYNGFTPNLLHPNTNDGYGPPLTPFFNQANGNVNNFFGFDLTTLNSLPTLNGIDYARDNLGYGASVWNRLLIGGSGSPIFNESYLYPSTPLLDEFSHQINYRSYFSNREAIIKIIVFGSF